MFDPSGRVLDLYDDSDMSLVGDNADRLVKAAGTADVLSPDDLAELPDEEYALVLRNSTTGRKIRKYAMVSPAHVALSSLFFETYGYQLPEECRKVAAYQLYRAHHRHHMEIPAFLQATDKDEDRQEFWMHELDDPVDQWDMKEANAQEAHIPNSEFLYVKEAANGDIERYYHVTNVLECKEALADFEQTFHQFDPAERVIVAEALKEAAGHYKLASDGAMLGRYTSREYNSALPIYVNLRAHLLGKTAEADGLREFLKQAGQMDPLDFATQLYEFDKQTKLARFWDRSLVDPFASVLGGGIRQVKVGDDLVSEEDIRKAASNTEVLQRMFRSATLEKFAEDPVGTFLTLPPRVQSDVLARAQ